MKKEISYYLKCRKNTKKWNIKGVAFKDKIGQQKSTCNVCDSEKINFFKTNKINKTSKKQKIIFANGKKNFVLLLLLKKIQNKLI